MITIPEPAKPGPVNSCPVWTRWTLTAFWDVARHYEAIVTFNGRGFDVPFLYLAPRSSMSPSPAKTGSYRYATEPHCDIAEQLPFTASADAKAPPAASTSIFYCKGLRHRIAEKPRGVHRHGRQ